MRTAILVGLFGAVVLAAVLWLPGRRDTSEPAPSAVLAQAASSSSLTQRDGGEGAVEVEVTLVVPGTPDAAKFGADSQTVFLVSMNTHSVDLAGYDLVKLSELLVAGQRFAPLRWVSTSDTNHHRSGALIFPKADRGAGLELRIKTIAGVPVRTFRWAP